MRDAARSGNKRWTLSNWDLRWKVTAVLAVPLLVAVVLGASRIAGQFSDSSDLAEAVKHVQAIPAVTQLSGAQGLVATEQMIMLGPDKSLVQDPDLTALDNAIEAAVKASSRLDNVPGGRSAIDQMIAGARAIRQQGAKPAPSIDAAIVQEEAIRQNSVRTAEAITSTVSDPAVEAAKLRLVDALNTRAVLVQESAAMAKALRVPDPANPSNPANAANVKDAIRDFLIASNTEQQMLNIMGHRFPEGDPTIADLQQLLKTRIQTVSDPQLATGQLPLQDLRNSAVESLDRYQKIVDKSSADTISRVNTLADNARFEAIRYAVIVVLTILAALILAVIMARSMIVPLRKLRLAALRVAEHDLGHEVSRLRDGASPEDVPLEPMPVHTDEEIGQLARAVDDIHGQALRLAADQAAMRTQVNDMFETLARRSKSLVDHQLSLIEAMEYDEKDPRLLENLFRLDHLAARMRRNGDNLLILAGTRQRRTKSAPVEIADVLRAAISEVEDYERVKLGATPRGAITEPAASDLAHLFAELLDNALRASPPETDVKFTFAQAHDQGLLIEVADRGIGMPPTEMAEINRRLEHTAEVGSDTARHMGLFVVGRLAERHGLTVRLRPTFDTARDPGVTVTVHVPKALIVTPAGGSLTVPPQPTQQMPSPQGPQSPSTPSSMQMRAVTRTPSGNVMVTVDPGVSGPIPAGERDRAAAANGTTTNGAAAPPPNGLPQRQAGTAIPGGLPQRQPGANGPTVRHGLADARPTESENGNTGLPQREPGAHGPLAPKAQPGANLPQRPSSSAQPQPGLAANMLKRQPGAAGQPPRPSAPGGLPQRQPGSNGLPPREPGVGGLPQRGGSGLPPAGAPKPGGLPDRSTGGLPQREPGSSGLSRESSANGMPPREAGPGGLPQRQPGANGLPSREPGAGGLPRRGVNGLPQRDSEASPTGLSQDPGSTGLPSRDAGSISLPPRDPGANGLPKRDAGPTGLPQRGSTDSGLPPRDSGSTGLPQRGSTESGLPRRGSSDSGLPQRGSTDSGLPQRGPSESGLPQRGSTDSGLPSRDAGSIGLPQRGSTDSGLPQRDSGLPQRGSNDSGLPRRLTDSGLPQRGSSESGLPQRESGDTGLPQHGSADSGLSARDSGVIGLPQRGPTDSGLPQRGSTGSDPLSADPGVIGLPQRGPRDSGLPRRGSTDSGLPPRDAGSIGLPQRGSNDSGLPSRDGGDTGLPQRGANGLPQRGATGLPPRDPGVTGLPQRDPGLPRREAGGNGLPQRGSGNNGLPQRDSGSAPRHSAVEGLPQRQPGAGLPPRPAPTPGLSLPQPDAPAAERPSVDAGDGRERGRHSFRANPEKAASFFQTRLQPTVDTGGSMDSPIFAEMMSAWLSDPNPDRSQVAAAFESPGDEGWQAARRAVEAQPEKRTPAGLPQRNPGNRLVPGGVTGNADNAPRRDPESIRSSLSRHQQGVRDGRAVRAMNLTGDKGDR
ncbi:ATP-binding protein [Nocardia sp. NPDC051570]|uniref:HAMP domain-containing sensor histidine kinase n=1 Tax=Nocardia sp. NPDC051570 TaxID=3364324 RepID=UPI0037B54AA8